jgi:hypothetical protein
MLNAMDIPRGFPWPSTSRSNGTDSPVSPALVLDDRRWFIAHDLYPGPPLEI